MQVYTPKNDVRTQYTDPTSLNSFTLVWSLHQWGSLSAQPEFVQKMGCTEVSDMRKR